MKRFAAHYLLLPDVGFIRQQVVEIADEGYVRDVFPLTEEIESVEWMPGLIALLPENKIKNTEMFSKNISVFQFNLPIVSGQLSHVLKRLLQRLQRGEKYCFLIYFILLILLPCSLSPELGTDYCGSDSYVERFRGFFSLWIIGDIKFPIDECFHFFSYSVTFISHYDQSVGG